MDKAVKEKSYSKPAAQDGGGREKDQWFSEVNWSKEKDENKRKKSDEGGKAKREWREASGVRWKGGTEGR